MRTIRICTTKGCYSKTCSDNCPNLLIFNDTRTKKYPITLRNDCIFTDNNDVSTCRYCGTRLETVYEEDTELSIIHHYICPSCGHVTSAFTNIEF